MLIYWKVKSENLDVASLRYRCLLPLRYLNLQGHLSLIYSHKDEIKFHVKPGALIFVKSFTNHDLDLAKKASQEGIPIILDVCDNILVEEYSIASNYSRRENFKKMAQLASVIVTTSTALKSFLVRELSTSIPIQIVPDANETIEEFKNYRPILQNNQELKTTVSRLEKVIIFSKPKALLNVIKKRLNQQQLESKKNYFDKNRQNESLPAEKNNQLTSKENPTKKNQETENNNSQIIKFNSFSEENIIEKYRGQDLKQIIWFGIHGTKTKKMLGLLEISEQLIEVYQKVRFCLHIVSEAEAYDDYCRYIQPLPFPTHFTLWNQYLNYQCISQSHLTIIPNSLNEFDICKSANRAILSLSLGVPVVATKTPALIPFKDCVIFDDWQRGIYTYLNDPNLVAEHIRQAQSIIQREYNGKTIAEKWSQIINKFGRKSWTNFLVEKYVKFKENLEA